MLQPYRRYLFTIFMVAALLLTTYKLTTSTVVYAGTCADAGNDGYCGSATNCQQTECGSGVGCDGGRCYCCACQGNCGGSPDPVDTGTGGSGGSCFLPGTKVRMEDGSTKNIEDVRVGDRVLTYDSGGSKGVHEVLELESPIREGYYEVALADGTLVKVTSEHPMFFKNNSYMGWGAIDPTQTLEKDKMRVEKFLVGDFLKKEDGSWTKIVSMTYVNGPVKTYNLKNVAGANTFFAEGIYVHNKNHNTCNPSWGGCSASCGNGTQSDGCGGSRSCCSECGPTYGSYGVCSGSPATKTRTLSWNCQGDTTESANCTGNLRGRAVKVFTTDTTCGTIRGIPTTEADINGTTITFTPSSPSQPSGTQAGANYVSFPGVVGGTYTIDPQLPSANWVTQRACWTRDLNAPTTGEGLSATLSVPTEGETLTWDVGYRLGMPWTQVEDGDVYAATNVSSLVPQGISPRVFARDGTAGFPGIVTYGTSYDFAIEGSTGGNNVSSKNWLVNESYAPINYYQIFYQRLGAPTTPDSFPDLSAVGKPASRATPYYVEGDMTTSGDWVVGDGESIIFLVNGNLTINGKITISGAGFIAFIVNGNITVSSSVGVPYSLSTPVVEGVYVTNASGVFSDGTSSAGVERFVGKGTFVAGSFLLQRDLDSVGQNHTTASELFLYNPRLLLTMPDAMRDVPITWEEVAP